MRGQYMRRAEAAKEQVQAIVDHANMQMAPLMVFTLIICVLLYCKYFRQKSFSPTGVILLLIGFGTLVLLHSIGGFLEPTSTGHRVMVNIGNILALGLLLAALFVEMTVQKSAAAGAPQQSHSTAPPPL
jgi:uncharacterized membrane protein YfhO